MTPRLNTVRDRLGLALIVMCAIPCGLAVGLRPSYALLLAAAATGLVICALLPIRQLPALLLAVTVVVPSLVLEGLTGSGQSRAVTLILALTLLRVVISRSPIAVPPILSLGVGTALGLTLFTALIATSRPPSEVGTSADLVRDLTLPLAALIGVAGGAHAGITQQRLTIPRVFAYVGIVAALASVAFWAWEEFHLHFLASGLFQQLAATSTFGKRSTFPFVEDSPNTGAVMFVLVCAFAAPPLLLAARGRDRALAIALVAACLAAVLTTQSRTGLSAAGAGALAYLVLVKRGGGKRSNVLIMLVLFVSVGAYVFGTFPAERATDDTLQARTYIWGQAARAFLQDPIIGHGYKYSEKGNFVEAAGLGSVSHHQSTHNDILSHLVDGGVVGTAIFLLVLGLMFALARRSVGDRDLRPLGIGYSCMLTAMIVSGIDNTLSESAAVITFQWLVFGVIAGLVAVQGDAWRAGGRARWLGRTWLRRPQSRTASHYYALPRGP